jgi:hypothetical protein
MMSDHRVHAVAVLGVADDDDPSNPPVWGIVSDLDVVRRAVRTGLDRTAGECAVAPVVRAEVAVEVADDLHQLGLATLLVIRLAQFAEDRQITHFFLRCCLRTAICSRSSATASQP